MALEGVDYAFPPRPRPSELVRLGKKFAVRYGGPGTANKWITDAEARELTATDIKIVANAEGSAAGLLGGWSTGVSWATSADVWFRSIGMPLGRPIYLSIDFEVTSSQWPTVASALRGAASVIGLDRLGVYGGRNAIRWAQQDDAARWFWQTYAWSYGTWEPNTHMQQYRNGVQIDGADCDLNRALTADFGQWTLARRGVKNVFFLQVKGEAAVYVSDGISTRNMPAGTWETTCLPLIDTGVPFIANYETLDALLAAGGPLVTQAKGAIKLTGTLTASGDLT